MRVAGQVWYKAASGGYRDTTVTLPGLGSSAYYSNQSRLIPPVYSEIGRIQLTNINIKFVP